MCFVLAWKWLSRDRVMATWLSQYSMVRLGEGPTSSPRSVQSHVASLVVCVMAMYSASVVDTTTTGYFFKLHETAPPLIRYTYLEIECWCVCEV